MTNHQYETFALLVRDIIGQHPDWTASPDARADYADDIEQAHRDALRLTELTRWHDPHGGDQRPAEADETCTCGRPAIVVIDTAMQALPDLLHPRHTPAGHDWTRDACNG